MDGGHGHESDSGVLQVLSDGVRQHLPHGLVDPAHPLRRAHANASRSLHEAIRRSTRTPCGSRASSQRSRASQWSAASPWRPAHTDASSVERCQASWWATSATATPKRCWSPALTALSSARLAFKDPASGKNNSMRRTATNASAMACLQGALDLLGLEHLEHVALLDVLVVAQDDAALEAGGYLAYVVGAASQRLDLTRPHHGAVAHEAHVGTARDPALRDVGAGDDADPGGAEGLADL